MKNNWQTKELGEVLEYEQPTPYIVSSKNYKEEYETPVLTAGKSFILGKTKEKGGIFPKDKLPVIIFDDFTTATQFVDFPFKVKSSAMKILHPVKKISDAKFLFYLIQTINFNYKGIHKRYWISEYSKIKILLPPLPEQQRIVKILDETFERIEKAKENAEKNLKNAKELFESYLNNIFVNPGEDWEKTTIGEVCNLITGGTPSKAKSEYFKNGTINWLVSGDVNKKEIKDCDGKITELGLQSSNTKYLPLNSVMIALNGQGKTRGMVAMLRIKATCNQSLVSIYPKNDLKLLPEIIFANLDGRYNEIRKLTGDTGNDRRGLNMPIIRSIKFSFPKSLSEQKSIVTKLDNLSVETKKLELIYKQKLANLEELKKSVLKKTFNGEL